MDNFLPWQQQQWSDLNQLHRTNRLPHALLFTGQSGLGKYVLAMQFAKSLLCKATITPASACHTCNNCLLVAAQTHPDLTCVVPENVGKAIKIEQIRHLIQHSNQTTQSTYKIIIINPAESLLAAASNALLKNLEEPTERTLFILISDKPGLLLPTIRSRCQFIRFTPPPPSLGKSWVRSQLDYKVDEAENAIDILYHLANGGPLKALEYAKTDAHKLYADLLLALAQLRRKEIDPIKLTENYLKTDLSMLLHCLMKIVSDLIKCHFISEDQTIPLRSLAAELDPTFLLDFFDQLIELQQHTKIALNQSLLLEDLFCHWFLQGEVCTL
ncbi:DNA polymerase III subunit delta' [Rickettsiella endosymbiont of Dermanyssus gallinae]|uniref:DNA polymerase III subunit delta' n=1 Tax=Rickettsiella endosymbiont of Dermanyssus gallinae TaxID=2856608 RepID=UPI001C527CDF|nr:DNA polymerase III subunit delta' [Rickettsiella endosymbiont of Dermanyssus gallinae]